MNRAMFILALFLFPMAASAHDDENKPKTPSRAVPNLKRARSAMDALKKRLIKEGRFGCCMDRPMGSSTPGCDQCVKTSGSCSCGTNLASGKGVCGECHGAWTQGHGAKTFGKVDLQSLKLLPSDLQGTTQADKNLISTYPEMQQYVQEMTAAKRILVSEKRFNCCVGNGGCDECAHEGYCPCGVNLVKDLEAKPKDKKRGVCGQCLDGQHGGHSRLGNTDMSSVTLASMEHDGMQGLLGTWMMNREGSGTTWQPDESPIFGKMGQIGSWQTMQTALLMAAYTQSGGPRGESQVFVPSQWMMMGRREIGSGILGLRAMLSADPLLIGGKGYANLLQTGETYGGQPLKDRQHPHDLIMELAASYSTPFGKGDSNRLFAYLAPVGEPAIAMSAFQHRATAWDNPLAPISHHWFDGTHVTFGVATLGITHADKWKAEISSFTGREPDEDRYGLDKMRFDSQSGRITFNPNRNWSLQTSYASIHDPEGSGTGNVHRLTTSAQYARRFDNGSRFDALLGCGRNIRSGSQSDAWLVEVAWSRGRWTAFGRWESVDKDELVGVPAGNYPVQKSSLGLLYQLKSDSTFNHAVGAEVNVSRVPPALENTYGRQPIGFTLYYRGRFAGM